MCILLVSIIFMRFKAVEKQDFEGEKTIREAELRKEISIWKNKYEDITNSLELVNKKITEYNEQIEKNEDTSALIDSELKETNKLLGKTTVVGEGVIVTLKDTDKENILGVDLSELINELRYAGAEAISINGIRILSLTDITDATNDLILINGNRIISPYVVKAIGNQTSLYSTLSAKNGFIDYYTKKYNLDIQIEKDNKIIVDSSEEDLKFKYIKEGEE